MKNFLILFSLFVSLLPLKAETTFKEDLYESVNLLIRGSYTQFTTSSNLYYAAAAVPSVWYSFEHDDRIKSRYGGTEIKNIVDHIGDLGVVTNFPVIHGVFYYVGKKNQNNHHVQFAKEYAAAMYLALAETGIMSYFYVHSRPVVGDESFWETEFRGKSSWPSGHVVPYMTLFFKTLQFYGPAWSSLPLVLSVAASMQRIQDQKHWLSDVTTSFFLSAWASEGVRKAAGYKKNHPFYKFALEHNLQFGVFRKFNTLAPMVALNF